MATRKDSSAGLPADSPSPSLEPLPFASGPLQIGTSSGNRPLEIFRFGNGVSQLLIVAGIHGGYEYNTIDLARQLIEHIRLHPEIIPDNKTLFILPVLNPDGEAIGYKPAGRSNGDGVDLNRNFPVNWQADWDRSGCWQSGPISAGAKPLSEPESRALSDFISSQNIDALLSYHSAGIGIYPGGHSYHPASNQLAEKLASVSTFPFPGLDTGCETTGMLVDYAADLDIAAVDLELATHWDTQFETNLAVLQAFLAWSYEEPKNRPSFPSK
jgi:predicted deacylase